MLTIHHLQNSRSQRVLWLLEELNLEYEIIIHGRNSSSRTADESLKKIQPLGKAPVLCDGNITLAETGAIFEYLLDNYSNGKLQPLHGSPERIFYTYWRHFSEGSLMPLLSMKLVFSGIVKGTPFFIRPLVKKIFNTVDARYLNPNLFTELDYIEQHLTQYTWFSGEEFTAADILIGFLLEAVSGRSADVQRYPAIAACVARIQHRPAYKSAIKKGNWSTVEFNDYWACLLKK
jgi:glutathione S-transferase